MLNCFEENALLYLLRHTQGVKFLETVNPDFYEIVVSGKVCKTIHKDELFKILLSIYEVN